MPNINIKVGGCYGLQVAGKTMGEFKVFNGKVIAETTKGFTLKYMNKNAKVVTKKFNDSDIIKAVKL